MGEYANGGTIKIGTCEDMFYLRADQRHLIRPDPGSVDPMRSEHLEHLRFRFPWPDEDQISPGMFKDCERSLALNVPFSEPLQFEHGSVQFVARVGMNLSLPCPLGPEARKDIRIHKNGFSGEIELVQTAFRHGEWRVVVRCGACHHMGNLPLQWAEELALAIRSEADRNPERAAWLHEVATRALSGYRR